MISIAIQEFEQKCLNIGSNSLKLANRSQSMSALANDSQKLKRTNMSSSTMSLDSPNKDAIIGGRNRLNESESEGEEDDDEEETTKSQTSDSDDEEESIGSSQTKQSSFLDEDDDDNAVQVRPIAGITKQKPDNKPEPQKRGVPVPQVRFSKLVNHMKK